MFPGACVILFTIGLMATYSLLIHVTVRPTGMLSCTQCLWILFVKRNRDNIGSKATGIPVVGIIVSGFHLSSGKQYHTLLFSFR